MFILTENLHGGDGLAAPAHAVLGGAHIVPGLLPGHRVKHQLVPGEIRVRSAQGRRQDKCAKTFASASQFHMYLPTYHLLRINACLVCKM